MNSALLKGKIRENDMTQAQLAVKIGISRSRFNAKINNKEGAEFTLGEAKDIKTVLGLDSETWERIFFS